MSNTESDTAEVIRQAAVHIIGQRYRSHDSKSVDAMTRAIYVRNTPAPTKDAAQATLIVERVLAETITAEAVYHDREARRFKDALAALEALETEANKCATT